MKSDLDLDEEYEWSGGLRLRLFVHGIVQGVFGNVAAVYSFLILRALSTSSTWWHTH